MIARLAAAALLLALVASGARCAEDVSLGTAPASDASRPDDAGPDDAGPTPDASALRP